MSNNAGAHALPGAALITPAVYARADNADTAKKSNNPLNLAPGANLQDDDTPNLCGTNVHTNNALMRGTFAIAPGEFMGVRQLLHATQSICTRPHYTPLGLGGGNVWKSCSNILNAFVTFGKKGL